MRKIYRTPEVEYVDLLPLENISLETGEISNPFAAAVAEDEAAESAAREAAMAALTQK